MATLTVRRMDRGTSDEFTPDREPVAVECPECGKEGETRHRENLCSGCGTWFEVENEEWGEDSC